MGTPDAQYRLPKQTDVLDIAASMRPADVLELEALGLTPEEGLVVSWNNSIFARTLVLRDQPAAMWGVWPALPAPTALGAEHGVGVWLLTGAAVDRYPKAFVRACRAVLASLLDFYPMLVNVVDARHSRALRMVAALGFEVLPAVLHGPQALPFHPIRLRRTSWAP